MISNSTSAKKLISEWTADVIWTFGAVRITTTQTHVIRIQLLRNPIAKKIKLKEDHPKILKNLSKQNPHFANNRKAFPDN